MVNFRFMLGFAKTGSSCSNIFSGDERSVDFDFQKSTIYSEKKIIRCNLFHFPKALCVSHTRARTHSNIFGALIFFILLIRFNV